MIIPVAEGMTTPLAGVMVIAVKSLIGLVLVLAYLGSVFILAFVFGRAAAWGNDAHPNPMVTEPPGVNHDQPASVSPHPAIGVPYEEVFYAQVDRFDDPEGDL
jgi:hypothetical protein